MIALFAALIRWNAGPRTIDDSYITYRYARNLLENHGFVYNPGERILGTTTPLYTLILTMISFPIGGSKTDFPQISLILNSLIDGVTCLFLFKLGRELGSPWIGYATALGWAIAPFSVTFAIGGLETSLYVFLLLMTVYYYIIQAYRKSAFFAALAFLTRPDALILILPIILDLFFTVFTIKFPWVNPFYLSHQNQKIVRKVLIQCFAIFSIPILIWVIFATVYFGTPLPHSVIAKSLAYHLPANAALIRLLQHYATPFFEDATFHQVGILLGLFIYPSLSLIGILHIHRTHPHSFAVMIFPWLYFAVFAIAHPLIFRWYLTPPLFLYFLSIFSGLDELIKQFFIKFYKAHAPANTPLIYLVKFALLFIIPTFFVSQAWTLHPDHGIAHPAPKMAWYKLELLYRQAAEIINQQPFFQNNMVIAAGDVGVLGYYTQAKILDTVGLNSSQTLKYYPLDEKYYVINYAIPPKLITDLKPDYVVFLEVYGRKSLLQDAEFLSTYHLIAKLDTDIYDSHGLLIYHLSE
ncbi:MAG: hypothetical protein ACPL0B_02930 [Anaerolineales bacterium]